MGRTTDTATEPVSRRRALALLGGGLTAAVAGCSTQSTGAVEYEESATVDDLPPSEVNASDPSVATRRARGPNWTGTATPPTSTRSRSAVTNPASRTTTGVW